MPGGSNAGAAYVFGSDPDADGDGVPDASDNCPTTPNAAQSDVDLDGAGDACDTEGPSPNTDGLAGADDCTDGVDNDGDSLTDGFDPGCDSDGDTIADIVDNCPSTPNLGQSNVDGDGFGDACDTEGPNGNTNGIGGGDDCLDLVDNDGDSLTDFAEAACLPDGDADGQPDGVDSCPSTFTNWTTPLGDTDCDSFIDSIETFVGTDPNDSCADTAGANNDADDRWPADTNDDQIVTVFDLVPYIAALNSPPGPNYVARLDLNTDAVISVFDLVPFIQLLNEPCLP